MSRNFGGGLQVLKSCTRKNNPWWSVNPPVAPKKKSSFENLSRYMSFLYELQKAFEAGGFPRKADSVDGVRNGIINYWMNPAEAIVCFVKNSAEWVPPTYNEYKVMWEYYRDLPTVVSRYYEGYSKPPATGTGSAIPITPDDPENAPEEDPALQEMNTILGSQYKMKRTRLARARQRKRGRQTGAGTTSESSGSGQPGVFSTSPEVLFDFKPQPGSQPSEEVSISPEDVALDGGMGLGLKVAIGLGVLGIGAFVARRQGWI